MVSTRQMSITTVGPEIGATNVVVNNASNRNAANNNNNNNSTTIVQQSGSSISSLRQQSSNSMGSTSVNAIGGSGGGNGGGGGSGSGGSSVNNATKDTGIISKHKQLSLQDMPFEILDKILSYVGYKQVSSMRLVSTQMNQTCVTVLNSTFSKLQTQLMKRLQNIKKVMPRRESARRSHPLSNECDIVETCCMRLSLLQMAFGRYIEHKHCCFFPGAILDEVYNVINYMRTTPHLGRPYKITEELIDLSTMAMEYFKDHLEPNLPQFGLFSLGGNSGGAGTSTSTKSSTIAKNCYLFESSSSSSKAGQSSSMPSPPQSNMVLRKGIRKIKQGMKKYNNQLTVLRTDLRFCKRKSTDQAKQITELQNMLAEQQKQTLEYANRLDENDKKSEEMSRKISTLLQELNKCKIELHYWRSKSPGVAGCNNCGQTTLAVPPAEDILALMNQSMGADDMNVTGASDADSEMDVQKQESNLMDLHYCTQRVENCTQRALTATTHLTRKLAATMHLSNTIDATAMKALPATAAQACSRNPHGTSAVLSAFSRHSPTVPTQHHSSNGPSSIGATVSAAAKIGETAATAEKKSTAMANPLLTTPSTHNERATTTGNNSNCSSSSSNNNNNNTSNSSSVILTVGTPRFYGKRKADDVTTANDNPHTMATAAATATNTSTAAALGTNASSTTSSSANVKTATNIANAANNSNISDNCNKKARRVQNKIKCQTSNVNIKTRNK